MTILEYNAKQSGDFKALCDKLYEIINHTINNAENKIWHGNPVWFIGGNPVVGYSVLKNCVQLLFWSGQSFKTKGLSIEGKFKAAQLRLNHVDEIPLTKLNKWLKESESIQWDYKNIVKRKGVLLRLK